MRHATNWKRFAKPSALAAIAATLALAFTAACGNQGNNDQDPRVTTGYAQNAGLTQQVGGLSAGSTLLVNVSDPSSGVTFTTQITPSVGVASWGTAVTMGNKIYQVESTITPTGKVLIMLAWAPPGSTAIYAARCQAFNYVNGQLVQVGVTGASQTLKDISACPVST